MNQYIVSQWFKYKDDLKSFYENRFPDVDEMQELDFEEPLCVAEMGKEVLTNLLKYVINRGKDSIKLRLVDSTGHGIPDTCCVDCFFYLKDRNGYPWTLSTFYGTGDTIVDWNGLTKKQWLTLMMHLSLGMVQDLRRCNEGSGSSILVSGNGSYVCRIKYLVDLKGLVKRSNVSSLSEILGGMPRKSIEPLFALMSAGQRKELENALDAVAVECEELQIEKASVQYQKWVRAKLGKERAKLLLEKIAEFGLKGYFAICLRYDEGIGDPHYFNDEFCQRMEDYGRQFDGNDYYIVVAKTLYHLLERIGKTGYWLC